MSAAAIVRLADGVSRRTLVLLGFVFAALLIAPWIVNDYLLTVNLARRLNADGCER